MRHPPALDVQFSLPGDEPLFESAAQIQRPPLRACAGLIAGRCRWRRTGLRRGRTPAPEVLKQGLLPAFSCRSGGRRTGQARQPRDRCGPCDREPRADQPEGGLADVVDDAVRGASPRWPRMMRPNRLPASTVALWSSETARYRPIAAANTCLPTHAVRAAVRPLCGMAAHSALSVVAGPHRHHDLAGLGAALLDVRHRLKRPVEREGAIDDRSELPAVVESGELAQL
jgi:hypothetical protein